MRAATSRLAFLCENSVRVFGNSIARLALIRATPARETRRETTRWGAIGALPERSRVSQHRGDQISLAMAFWRRLLCRAVRNAVPYRPQREVTRKSSLVILLCSGVVSPRRRRRWCLGLAGVVLCLGSAGVAEEPAPGATEEPREAPAEGAVSSQPTPAGVAEAPAPAPVKESPEKSAQAAVASPAAPAAVAEAPAPTREPAGARRRAIWIARAGAKRVRSGPL